MSEVVQLLIRIKDHLIRQGVQSTADDGGCVYRGEGGTSCAVGCLIPDEVYNPAAEGCSLAGLSVVDGKWSPAIPRADFSVKDFPEREALANMMNAAGIPATQQTLVALSRAQRVHDHEDENQVASWDRDMTQLISELQDGAQ